MTASAEDRAPGEKVKMTVSERSIGALGPALHNWLAGRLDRPGELAVSEVRTPTGGNGLSSTSVLFEASWLCSTSLPAPGPLELPLPPAWLWVFA